MYADRLAEHVETLAHHWLVAEEWEKALDYAEQAGDARRRRSPTSRPSSFFEQAVELADEAREPRPLAASIAFRLGDVHLGDR